MRISRRCKQFICFLVALSLCFVFSADFFGMANEKSADQAVTQKQQELSSYDLIPVDIACNQETLSGRGTDIFIRNSVRSCFSFKAFRVLLLTSIFFFIYLFVRLRILWVSQKATTRSQKFTIQYIHDKDGRKA